MRELVDYVAVSIDGYIAAPDRSFEEFPLEGDHMETILTEYADALPTMSYGPAVVLTLISAALPPTATAFSWLRIKKGPTPLIRGNLSNWIVDPEVILGIVGRSATRYDRDELPSNVFTIGRERHVYIFRTSTDDTRAGTLATQYEYLRTSLNRLDNSLRSTVSVVPAPVVSASR